MKTVQVLLSSYNGEKYIEKQLDTIFSQKGVDISCLVRVDGSKDDTLNILKEYQKKEPRLKLIEGKNIGWRKSFMELLYLADEADFYAFSDQDDEWFDDKLITGVNYLKERPENIPLLFHCARIRKDQSGEWEQQMLPKPFGIKNALMQEYCQGCAIMINRYARNLLCEYRPKGNYGHDFWIGVVCYLLGEVYYSSKPLFYHINHIDNTTSTGNVNECKKTRFKSIISGKSAYNNPCQDLLDGYKKYMPEYMSSQIREVNNYKKTFLSRIKLFFDPKFVRSTKTGTVLLKLSVLIGSF